MWQHKHDFQGYYALFAFKEVTSTVYVYAYVPTVCVHAVNNLCTTHHDVLSLQLCS